MTDEVSASWFERHPRKARWLVFGICFLFVELTCRLLVSAGLLHHETYPTTSQPTFWAYIDPVVGMWRYPNATLHHQTECIDEVYRTNSAGARDPERRLESIAPRRVVVLGDSMAEGHGVARGERVTDLLEERTGIEHLNFGTSGSFGTIQQWLYYREYASQYDHSDVFVFILPANDFADNDIDQWKKSLYRPYLRKQDGTFEVYYPVEFENRNMQPRSLFKIVKHTLENNIYVLNALRHGLHVFKEKTTSGQPLIPLPEMPSYLDYSPTDLEVMLYALEQIALLAGERNVYLFSIPVESDADAARLDGYSFALIDRLSEFAAQRDNVSFLDLLPGFLDYTRAEQTPFVELTLGCNKHWSILGNEVVADAVYEFVYAD